MCCGNEIRLHWPVNHAQEAAKSLMEMELCYSHGDEEATVVWRLDADSLLTWNELRRIRLAEAPSMNITSRVLDNGL